MTQAPFLPLSTVPTSSYDKHSSRGSTQFCDRKLGPSHVVVAFCLFWAMLPSNTIIGVTISFRSFSSISHTVSNHIISDKIIVSSDRSSYSDDGPLYIRQWQWQQLFQILTQSLDAIDATSVTLSRLNSINAIDVTRC